MNTMVEAVRGREIRSPHIMANTAYDTVRIVIFSGSKLVFDRVTALLALPLIGVIALILLIINPIFNPGPLFFVQTRMGKNLVSFRMIKFRTMVPAAVAARDPNSPLEVERITPLGRFLRKSRLDELPNFLNVLKGEMSTIGPRPDSFNHGQEFSRTVPGYSDRHVVRPGITGLAQTEMGYAEGTEATRQKVHWDLTYIRRYGFRQEFRIFWRTVYVMATGFGAR